MDKSSRLVSQNASERKVGRSTRLISLSCPVCLKTFNKPRSVMFHVANLRVFQRSNHSWLWTARKRRFKLGGGWRHAQRAERIAKFINNTTLYKKQWQENQAESFS